jgi:nonribosomal peptide synthetase protein BlmIV
MLDDPLERELADIWSSVLGCAVDSALTHFFAQGGDSLSAIRVLALVNERYSTSMTLGDLFDAPVLGQFASRVRAGEKDACSSPDPTTWVEEEL